MTILVDCLMLLVMMLGLVTASEAQQADTLFTLQTDVGASPVGVIEAMPLESVTSVPNAPFRADAETEFTQVLGDGNRIERRYSSMIARDSQGRTRRDEEIALVGPLAVDGPSPRLVTILDPVAGHSFTLDDSQRIAYRNPMASRSSARVTTPMRRIRRARRCGSVNRAITPRGKPTAKPRSQLQSRARSSSPVTPARRSRPSRSARGRSKA